MKCNWSGFRFFVAVGLLLATASPLFSEPRGTLPPWPEVPLGIWSFDHWSVPLLPARAAVGIENAQMAESWSGYALVRDGLAVSPVAIPVTDPYLHRTNFATSQGTLRFWFRPDWSSAGTNSSGPGAYVRLLELVSLYGNQPEVLYSLYLNPQGNVIYLSGQGVGGPMDFLKAEVNWRAGQWYLVALAYEDQRTTLFVDAVPVATGSAFPPVASWKREALALLIGSDLAAANTAQGQFDELCTFDSPLDANDLTWYWKAYRWTAALGPVGTERDELRKAQWFQAMLQAESGVTNAEPAEVLAYRTRPEEYPTNALWLDIGGVTNDVVTMRLQGTVPDTMYEILSQENFMTNAGWQSEGVWIGTEGQDWTDTPITVGTRTNQLFMWARSWKDEDGNGLPDWWEMQELGGVGTDGYADADGDGWVSLQEYQNGTSPTAFNTPAAPQGLAVAYNASNGAVTVNWLSSPGAVTGYVIERFIYETDQQTLFTNGAGTTIHTETFPIADPAVQYYSPRFTVTALYSSGNSQPSTPTSLYDPALGVTARLERGADDAFTLLASSVAPEASSLLLTRVDYNVPFGNPPARTGFTIAVSNLQSGAYTLPAAWTTNGIGSYWAQSWHVQGTAGGGREGEPVYVGDGRSQAFKDGREQLRQNLFFLLRAANTQSPFSYWWDDGYWSPQLVTNLAEYAYADYYSETRESWYGAPYLFPTRPFYNNYEYRNFVLSATNVYSNGFLNTGVDNSSYGLMLYLPATFGYTHDFVITNVPAQLPSASSRNLLQMWAQVDGWDWPEIGVTQTGSTLTLGSNARNVYGLPYLSMILAHPTNSTVQFITMAAGGSTAAQSGYLYPETADPVLQNTGYYFCQPWYDPFPGYPNFSTTNQTPVIIAAMADPTFHVAGYAKYSISNGYAGKFAYLGQYFDKAYAANTNGTRSTNETGILSPYGEFFATEPGKTFLTTKPDGVSTNIGECVVNVIKLQFDVNHDGTMNTSWTGPDNTSEAKPFVFWVNNDYDRGHSVDCIPGPCDWEEDDLSATDTGAASPVSFPHPTPDCDYQTLPGLYQIPSARDLEDYSRLWLPGIAKLYEAHSNLLFQLSIADNDLADGPAFNICQAVETNGGSLYLTDTNVAAQQVFESSSLAGRLQPGSTVLLNNIFLLSGRASDYLIFCGARRGKGRLVLTVKDGTNVLAETSTWIHLKDIKEMYERWTVGEIPTNAPMNHATSAVEDLPVGTTSFRYNQPADTNTPYILHVHGSNMERWEKDRFAEVMYKRLYWQGYTGRFGSFRWPTEWGVEDLIDAALDASFFDRIEFAAWKSAPGLKSLLTTLNNQYPNQVRMSSHSMGNVVAGEALKQCTNNLVAVYASFQGAVPAHSYDSNAPTRSLGVYESGTPNAYAQYWLSSSNSYFAGAGGAAKYVNFYNTNDYVLAGWRTGQDFKPDDSLNYYMQGGAFEHHEITLGFPNIRTLVFPADTYELFSFCIEARCFALGAQNDVGGVFSTTNQVNVNGPAYLFGDKHKGHSGEFRSTNMKRAVFWNGLLIRMELKEE